VSMISYTEALEIVCARTSVLPSERRRLAELAGHYLAEAISAPFDMPRFDNTAVDGFAVRVPDVAGATPETQVVLRVTGTIRAGDAAFGEIVSGTAVKVLTGSLLPAGTEAVVMKEYTEESEGIVIVRCAVSPGEDIRRHGEEFRKGQTVLSVGTRVTPPVVGLLASLGMESALVRRRPRVALVITGNELVDPGKILCDGQIYDSNSPALVSALRELPVELVSIATCPDELDLVKESIRTALSMADVIITVGGASVGDRDFVKEALRESVVDLHFTRVAIRPGKPVVFGTASSPEGPRLVFGLPGNPVSALVCFAVFVRPALLKMLGAENSATPLFKALLGADLRKKAGRMEFVRARLVEEDNQRMVYPTSGQDSHMLGGIATANALIHFPAEAEALSAGEWVTVERLPW
jgi:molybdopterin molybdotransferase